MSKQKPRVERTLEELSEEELKEELSDSKRLARNSVIPFAYSSIITGGTLMSSPEFLNVVYPYLLVTGILSLLVGVHHLYAGTKTYRKCKNLLELYKNKEEI